MDADQLPEEISRESAGTVCEPTNFQSTLADHGLVLARDRTTTLQVNVGLRCNQACRHCHLSAGPEKTENMDAATAQEVVAYAKRAHFDTIDITGGAPELNPNLVFLAKELSFVADRVMIRTNLTALSKVDGDALMTLFRDLHVVVVASFPSLNSSQTDAQRGQGIFSKSVVALRRLNELGYGSPGSGLELNLISNPSGAFLPQSQSQAEKRFREVLEHKWGIVFNNLFNFANVPLGRFRTWLRRSGNYERYMERIAKSFNPCAVEGVMCRTLVSVAWDGNMYDCDFNIAGRLPLGGRRVHVSEMDGPPEEGARIALAEHCYSCTAGEGFT